MRWLYLTVGNMRVEGSTRPRSGNPPSPYGSSYLRLADAKRAAEDLLPRCQSVTIRSVKDGWGGRLRATLTRKGWRGLDMLQAQESPREADEGVLPKDGRAPIAQVFGTAEDEKGAPVTFFVILPPER